jgi:hypothetical protein
MINCERTIDLAVFVSCRPCGSVRANLLIVLQRDSELSYSIEMKRLVMTPKKLSEFWKTQWVLTDIRPAWWKRWYIAVVSWISPPRASE